MDDTLTVHMKVQTGQSSNDIFKDVTVPIEDFANIKDSNPDSLEVQKLVSSPDMSCKSKIIKLNFLAEDASDTYCR